MTCPQRGYLTFDEQLAAEAAFQGLPSNPMWSSDARSVYDGIIKAMGDRAPFEVTFAEPADCVETAAC